MVTHQVIARARDLRSQPGLSDCRLQVLNCCAILPPHCTVQGHEMQQRTEQTQLHPRQHIILTSLSLSFLFAGWDKLRHNVALLLDLLKIPCN